MTVRVPDDALVILVGPSGSGKSTWAVATFDAARVVSVDGLRGLVGEAPHDQRAGADAFAVLDDVLDRRLRRGLLTVVDSLGLDAERRRTWIRIARRHGRPVHLVVFDVDPSECRRRNRGRPRPVPAAVLRSQLARWPAVRAELAVAGGADDADVVAVHEPGDVQVVAPEMLAASAAASRQEETPMRLRFGLHLSSFAFDGGRERLAEQLAGVARTAEQVGFESLWVMDHLVQIPQVGREWDDLLDATTTTAWLAATTQRVRIGVLVHSIALRHPVLVARASAALDVLSGGRAVCGLGVGWFEREHRLLGVDWPDLDERYDRLADALELLPLLWGPGAPSFEGRRLRVEAATCYPRPLQERLPVLVGGQGPRRTLPLVARFADACNLRGGPDEVRAALAALHGCCAEADRDPAEIEVTHLSTALVGADHADAQARLAARHPEVVGRARRGRALGVGSVRDQVGRYRALAEAGVHTAIVALADLDGPAAVERFAPVVAAFR